MNIEMTSATTRKGDKEIPPDGRPAVVASLLSLLCELHNEHACSGKVNTISTFEP
jgi:hypothetical protein